jgi:hypothetical protein
MNVIFNTAKLPPLPDSVIIDSIGTHDNANTANSVNNDTTECQGENGTIGKKASADHSRRRGFHALAGGPFQAWVTHLTYRYVHIPSNCHTSKGNSSFLNLADDGNLARISEPSGA